MTKVIHISDKSKFSVENIAQNNLTNDIVSVVPGADLPSLSSINSKSAWTKQLSVLPWRPAQVQNSRNIKKAYINHLETIPWNYFITGSTRYELTLKSTRRLFDRWFEALKPEGLLLFWVAEKFECKDGYHGHGLLQIPNKYGSMDPHDKLLFTRLIDTWQWATGNKAISNNAGKIEWDKAKWNSLELRHYDKKRGAGGYCAKYVFKNDADYDILT
jgi:hypothetical protein